MFLRKLKRTWRSRWSNCSWHLNYLGGNSLQIPSFEQIDQKIILHSLEYNSRPKCEIFCKVPENSSSCFSCRCIHTGDASETKEDISWTTICTQNHQSFRAFPQTGFLSPRKRRASCISFDSKDVNQEFPLVGSRNSLTNSNSFCVDSAEIRIFEEAHKI